MSTSVGRDDLPGLTSQVLVGGLDDTLAAAVDAPLYVPEARAHLVSLDPADAADLADASDDRLRPGLDHGLLALYQKCPHLGCRVPYCETSGWFECMCHGTMFTPTGEHRDGPSPRGMDAFVVVVDDAGVSIDTGELVTGAALGSVIVDRPPNGPHCVTAAGDR